MRLSEVVSQIQLVLPKYTDYFSTSLEIASIVATDTLATIDTVLDHNLSVEDDDAVVIVGVSQKNSISSISKDGLVYTIETIEDHDLTFGFPGYETISLGGFTDSEWNDNFKLLSTPTRKSFTIQSINTLPALNTNEYLSEIRIDGVNGRFAATVTSGTQFTIPGDFKPGSYTGGLVKKTTRIAGSVSIERALEQYTKQSVENLWMFVTMSDATISKDRNAMSDAVATIAAGEDIRMRMIDGFSIFIVKNTKNELAAVNALDIARHELLSPISKTLFGVRFSTGLSGDGDFSAIMTGHNFVEYNRATLVYQYNFEFVTDMTVEDAVENTDTKAFTDIVYNQEVGGDDTDDMSVGIKLID